MRYLIVLFLLLGCTEERIVIYKNCFDMTIPKGNPITFWLNGEESFNNKLESGMIQQCFFQPFSDSDTIKVQLSDTTGKNYSLNVYDVDDVLLTSIPFVETSGIYNVSFMLSTYSINDKYIKFKIFEGDINAIYSGWSSPLSTWSLVSPTFITTLPNNFSSHLLRIPFNVLSGDTVNYSFNLNIIDGGNGAGTTSRIIVQLSTAGAPSADLDDFNNLDLGAQVISGSITATADRDHFWISASATASSSYARDIEVSNIETGGAEQATSDLFYISDDDDTTLIQYGDKNNYAEIDYTAQQIYSLRLAGRFVKERSPEENESDQTSDGTVEKLSSTLKDQKLLQIEYAPPYIHKLMKRVLNHNTIYIDGKYWVKEENYETREVSESQLLQPASCWLTQKEDGYDTNIYETVTTI